MLSACDAQEPTAGLDVFRAKASEAIDRIKTAFDAKAIADNYTGDNTQLHGGLLRAIEAVPIFPEAVSKYASSLEAQDAVDWIEGHIERVGGGVPEFVVTLAVILYKMQEYERAEEKFLLAETMQGKGYFTMSHRVHLRYMQDRTIDALALLAEMGKLYPHEVYVHEIARAICSNMI
jgi:tetratricopeptide (TPR) repeat protein